MSTEFTTTPRTSRVYIHHGCGEGTVVGGGDFHQLCNPYSITVATICCNCGVVGLNSVAWQETGETVAAYRSRLRSLVPLWVRLLPLTSPLVGAALGGLGGLITAEGTPYDGAVTGVYAVVGVIAGFVLGIVLMLLFARRRIGVAWGDVD